MNHYYNFFFGGEEAINNIFKKAALDSAVLLHPENKDIMVIFYVYDNNTNGIIYYENEENWDLQYLPKEDVRKMYMDYRKNDYEPVKL